MRQPRQLGRRVSIGGLLVLACMACDETPVVPPPAAGRESPAAERADQPIPQQVEYTWMSRAQWLSRHRAHLADPVRARARVVLLGDSITQAWAESPSYRRHFGGYHPLGLGIPADHTQHVLWRVTNGALSGLHAELVVVMLGINNLSNGYSPEQTFRGVQAVVRQVERELPSASILLLCILPAGETRADPLRQKIQLTNRRLRALASERVSVLDVGEVFLDADARIAPELMADFLHPTVAGYERLTQAVVPELALRLGRTSAP